MKLAIIHFISGLLICLSHVYIQFWIDVTNIWPEHDGTFIMLPADPEVIAARVLSITCIIMGLLLVWFGILRQRKLKLKQFSLDVRIRIWSFVILELTSVLIFLVYLWGFPSSAVRMMPDGIMQHVFWGSTQEVVLAQHLSLLVFIFSTAITIVTLADFLKSRKQNDVMIMGIKSPNENFPNI